MNKFLEKGEEEALRWLASQRDDIIRPSRSQSPFFFSKKETTQITNHDNRSV